jgi:phage-related minor tail protein
MFRENISSIKNTEAQLNAGKNIGLEENTEKGLYMFMAHHQNAGKNNNLMTANASFKNVAKF